ncbi:MAG: MBL fold metallo-hydrolase [Luteolibacter sp.]
MSLLEDEFPDVISKAMLGRGIDAPTLAAKTGVSPTAISSLLDGEMDPATAALISPALGLDSAALIALPTYQPKPLNLSGIHRIEVPFGQWTVNAWLIEVDGTSLLFDTGHRPNDVPESLNGNLPDAVFITHHHPDHIGGEDALRKCNLRIISETEALAERNFTFGSLTISAVDLSGHKTPTAGYFIKGMDSKLLISGDAIFAGSIGKCHNSADLQTAFANLRRVLTQAGDDCIILPGHGPATTVAQELASNPFRTALT